MTESTETAPERSRTYTWGDPLAAARAATGMSGLDFLQAVGRGEVPRPPIMATLGYEPVEVGPGRTVFAIEPQEYHYNPIGMVHGGVACTLLDTAMACAVHSTLAAGQGYTTLELKVSFVRPLTRDSGRVRAEGTVIHAGGRVATAEGRIVDDAGKLYAHATTTCLILQHR